MIALWLTLLLPAVAADAPDDDVAAAQPTQVVATVVVAVTQRESAADALVDQAAALGGWFQSRTSDALSLRVPTAEVDALLETAAAQGKVLDRTITRTDVGQQIADVSGRLAARHEVLEQYYAVLAKAESEAIVMVERQVVQAIEQIETYEGQLRVLEDRSQYGRVEVYFQFRDRSAPSNDGSSPFYWLNTLNLSDVVYGHQRHRPNWRTRGVSIAAPPEGFSAWRREGRYRAASPDNVLYRVRSERHKPKATLAFWTEAVRERMIAAGYTVQAEAEIEANGVAGSLIELAAPQGTEDWSYLIAFFPKGRRIILAEAVGEVSALAERREAILTAMEALKP